MKLEGSLDAFGLPDVLQLLHATRKTGALSISQGGTPAIVHMLEGEVAGACLSADRLYLLRRLVAHGWVDEEAVGRAAEAAADTGDGLVLTMVQQGLVSDDVAREHAERLALDTMFELLRWTEGDFSFAADETPADDVGLRIAPDELVERALARSQQWEHATEVVSSPAMIPVPVAEVARDEVVMTPDQWSLLQLMDGTRTVVEVSDLTGNGSFDTVVAVVELVDLGLVRLAASVDDVADAAVSSRIAVLGMLDAAEALNAEPIADDVETERPTPPEPVPVLSEAHRPDDASSTVVHVPDHGANIATPTTPTTPSTPSTPAHGAAPSATASPTSVAEPERAGLLGGAHVPQDVVPPRPEPFLPQRKPEHAEATNVSGDPSGSSLLVPTVIGANAVMAVAQDDHDDGADPSPAHVASPRSGTADELREGEADGTTSADDPLLNRSLVLRLIAGVRGL